MAIRKAAGKLRASLGRKTKTVVKPIRGRVKPGTKEQRSLTQLMISGTLFVVLVAVKLLLPDRIGLMREQASRALEQNMDIAEVFGAVGRAFSGIDTVWESLDNVYEAVFLPQESGEAEELPLVAVGPGKPLQPFQNFANGEGSSSGWLTVSAAETEDGQTMSEDVPANGSFWVRYSEENLPENVQLQQVVLNFDYCAPISGGAVTSAFGYREHPSDGEERFHYGVDMTAGADTAIAAFANGTVTVVGESSSYGKYFIITHSDAYSTLYAHCSDIHVSTGQAVRLGETVAEVGDTGQTTGSHLHFELQRGGVYLNPIYYVI